MKPAAPVAQGAELVQGLGLVSSTTIVMGSMIGSGIFIVSADVARQVQSPGLLILAWLLTASMTVIGALSYGFDAVSTAAQEARNPQRNMPIGILGSLAVCTVLYILVSGLLTAVVPYPALNVPDPVAVGVRRHRGAVGQLPGEGGCHHRIEFGDAGHVDGSVPHLFFHVARRPVVPLGGQSPPAFSHALHFQHCSGHIRSHLRSSRGLLSASSSPLCSWKLWAGIRRA